MLTLAMALQSFHPASLAPIIWVLFGLAVIGLVVYLVVTYVPMSPPIKTVFIAIVVLVMAFWLLRSFGMM